MFQVRVDAGGLSAIERPEVIAQILEIFERKVGPILVDRIRKTLGSDELGYQLSPKYAARKPKLAAFKRYPGKTEEQPFILSGAMLEGVEARLEGEEIIVEVGPQAGVSPDGYDYAEKLESMADYIGVGVEELEEPMAEILLDIVFEVCSL